MVAVKPTDVVPSAGIKFFGAGTAACIADLITFPLDTAKVRLQVRYTSNSYDSRCFIYVLRKIHKRHNVPRSRASLRRLKDPVWWSTGVCSEPSKPWCAQKEPGVFTTDWSPVSRGRWALHLFGSAFMTPWSNSTLEAQRVSFMCFKKVKEQCSLFHISRS